MTQKEVNKLKMFRQVLNILRHNQPIWQPLPAFETGYQEFKADLTMLDDLIVQEQMIVSGITKLRNEKRKAVVKKAIAITGGLRAYATVSNNTQLIQLLGFSNSLIGNGSTVAIGKRLDLILEKAYEYAGFLTDVGIVQQDLDEFTQLRAEYKSIENAPRAAILEHKQALAEIDRLFVKIDTLLTTKLDQLSLVVQPANPGFYEKYKGARKIVDYKGKSNKKGDGPNLSDTSLG